MDFSKLKLSAMSPGTYTVKAIFDGDDTYKPTETTFILVVSEHASGSQFYPENPEYGDKTYPVLNFTEPEVTVTENSSGKYKIQLPNNPNNVDLTYSVSGGTLDIQAMTFEAEVGTYTISVTSPESSRYYSVIASYTLTIEEYNEETDPEVDPDIPTPTPPEEDEEEDKSILYFQRQLVYQQTNDSMVYDLQQPSLKEGVPSSILNSCYYTIDNDQTHIPIQPTITIQGEGQHIIYLHIPSYSTYEAHNIAYTLGIYSEIDLNTQSIGLRFSNSFYNYEDLESGTVQLPFTMTADYTQLNVSKFKLTVTESGTSSQISGCTVNVPNNRVTLNNLTLGKTYNVQLRYEGDDKYKPAVASCTVNVISSQQPDTPSEYVNQYLTLEVVTVGSNNKLELYDQSNHDYSDTAPVNDEYPYLWLWENAPEYSYDMTTWIKIGSKDGGYSSNSNMKITLNNVGDKVYFRGNYAGLFIGVGSNGGTYKIYGNIMSLFNKNNFATLTTIPSKYIDPSDGTQNCGIFCAGTGVVDITNLLLPATTLSYRCYQSMFRNCTRLTTIPSNLLPATTLAEYCYSDMFYGCTSLTTAPSILPATTLAKDCYFSMFYGCTSLTTAPELPATTLAERCYGGMFYGCTSLTTAPELPATTLADYCYVSMFRECYKLNYVKMLATYISAISCLVDWLFGVSSTGTFVKHPNANIPRGDNGIPSGWTVQTATS